MKQTQCIQNGPIALTCPRHQGAIHIIQIVKAVIKFAEWGMNCRASEDDCVGMVITSMVRCIIMFVPSYLDIYTQEYFVMAILK